MIHQGPHLLLCGGSLVDLRRLDVGYLAQHPEDQLFPRHLQAVDANRYPLLGGVHRHEKSESRLSHARAGGEHVERACPQPSHKPVQSSQPGMDTRRTAPGYPLVYLPYPCHGLGGGGRHVRYLVGEGELLAQLVGHRSQLRYQLLRIPSSADALCASSWHLRMSCLATKASLMYWQCCRTNSPPISM